MGKKSVKANKNRYQQSRENAGLTREKASEKTVFLSADRIEKLESERLSAHPEDILAMSEAYGDPQLPNYYCARECPIGKLTVKELEPKELTQITLEIVSSLNKLEKMKDRFIDISSDRTVTDEETPDFQAIKKNLDEIACSVATLDLWIKKAEMKCGTEE